MNPFIPKVVLVMEPRSAVLDGNDLAQQGAAVILNVLVIHHVQVGIFHTADVEAIEMLKFPSHRHLDECMKFFQGPQSFVLTRRQIGGSMPFRIHFDLKNGVGPRRKR